MPASERAPGGKTQVMGCAAYALRALFRRSVRAGEAMDIRIGNFAEVKLPITSGLDSDSRVLDDRLTMHHHTGRCQESTQIELVQKEFIYERLPGYPSAPGSSVARRENGETHSRRGLGEATKITRTPWCFSHASRQARPSGKTSGPFRG